MAYSPNVQYEAYKRLDFALSASSFLFFFLFYFLFDFATLKKIFFNFVFPLQNSFHRGRSCGRSDSGRTCSSSMEALAGAV